MVLVCGRTAEINTSDKHWGWTYSLYCGIITVLWIAFQQMMTEYFILQPVISIVGIFIIAGALIPRVKRWHTRPPL